MKLEIKSLFVQVKPDVVIIEISQIKMITSTKDMGTFQFWLVLSIVADGWGYYTDF